METEMAEELQREAEARNAVDEEDSEGAKPMQTSGPSLVLDEAAGKMGDGEKQRYGDACGSALRTAGCGDQISTADALIKFPDSMESTELDSNKLHC